MAYSTFSSSDHDATREPMFFGRNVNVARYDKQKYPIFEKLIEKQLESLRHKPMVPVFPFCDHGATVHIYPVLLLILQWRC